MQELLMQEHKQKLYKTCFCCGWDTWHMESKQILQPPNYLTIIVNRITYSNNRITKNKSRMLLDLCIKLGPYKFSLPASVNHHGYSMNSGHYTASINCCGKHFTVTIIKLLNVISRIPIIHLLPIYTFVQTHGMLGRQYVSKGVCRCWHCRGWELIDSHGTGTVVCPLQQVEE